MSIFPTFHWGLLSFLQDEQLLIETWTFKVLCYRLWVLVRPPVLAGICSITLLEEGSSPLLLPSRVGTPGPSSPLLTLKGGGAPSYCWMGVKDWLTWGLYDTFAWEGSLITALTWPLRWGAGQPHYSGCWWSPDSVPGLLWPPAWRLVTTGRLLTWCCDIAGFPHGLHKVGVGDLIAAHYMPLVVVQLLSCVWLFVTPWTAAHQASSPSLSPGIC